MHTEQCLRTSSQNWQEAEGVVGNKIATFNESVGSSVFTAAGYCFNRNSRDNVTN